MSEKIFEALRKRVAEEPYANHLGIELVEIGSGRALVRMALSESHRNIYGRCHGGAIFSLMDEAFQLAANSRGKIEIALNVSISYMKAPSETDLLYAEALCVGDSRRIGHYTLEVRNASGERIASAQATSYRRDDAPPFL